MNKSFSWFLSLGFASVLTACAGPPPPPQVAVSPPAPVAEETPKPAQESLTVDFKMAGAALSPEALSQLDGAARLYRDAKPEVMIISGHTDKTGEEFANLILSARRAEMVKRALVDRGIPADRLQIVADGEAERLPNITPTRSAVVTWR